MHNLKLNRNSRVNKTEIQLNEQCDSQDVIRGTKCCKMNAAMTFVGNVVYPTIVKLYSENRLICQISLIFRFNLSSEPVWCHSFLRSAFVCAVLKRNYHFASSYYRFRKYSWSTLRQFNHPWWKNNRCVF